MPEAGPGAGAPVLQGAESVPLGKLACRLSAVRLAQRAAACSQLVLSATHAAHHGRLRLLLVKASIASQSGLQLLATLVEGKPIFLHEASLDPVAIGILVGMGAFQLHTIEPRGEDRM